MYAVVVVVQIANVSGWLNALVDETDAFSYHSNWTHQLTVCFAEFALNESAFLNQSRNHPLAQFNQSGNHLVQCFSRTTDENELLEWASPYLYPFIMEYLMLVIECVTDWFFHDARAPQSRRNDRTEPPADRSADSAVHSDPSTTSDGGEGAKQQLRRPTTRTARETSFSDSVFQEEDMPQTVDRTPRPSTTTTVRESCVSDSIFQDESKPLTSRSTRRPDTTTAVSGWWIFINVILSLVVNFLLVIFGIYDFCCGEHWTTYRYLFVYYRIGYWLLLSAAVIVGYVASCQFPSESTKPNGFEYFVLLSCIGLIVQCIFKIVNKLMSEDDFSEGSPHKSSVIFGEVTHILQICVQVAFYFRARSVQIRANTEEENNNKRVGLCRRRSRQNLGILTGVMSYFVVCNFALWVETSFVETRSSENSWEKQYFDSWPVIYSVFNPMSLVFRFNSALLFLEVLLDKRRQNVDRTAISHSVT